MSETSWIQDQSRNSRICPFVNFVNHRPFVVGLKVYNFASQSGTKGNSILNNFIESLGSIDIWFPFSQPVKIRSVKQADFFHNPFI